MLHGMAILYARWFTPEEAKSRGDLAKIESGMSINVIKDINWLQDELSKSKSGFLVGDRLTAADIMMHFSVQVIFKRQLGIDGTGYPLIQAWLRKCEETESYQRAVQKSGYRLL